MVDRLDNSIQVGDIAPDFSLEDGDGKAWKLSEYIGRVVVLLFYPGDETPVCTKQLCSLRDSWEDYVATGAEIVGISTDSIDSHKRFAGRYQLPIKLLSDIKGDVSKAYDVRSWLPGRTARAVIVIDKEGRISYRKVEWISLFRPSDEEIIKAIKEAQRRD
jgi:thioredoxin-dependent peroxiredoxin